MTPRLGPLSYRKVRRVLLNHGFVEVGQRGSHVYFQREDGKVVTLPRHDGRDIGTPLLLNILRQAGIDPDELRR